MIIESIDGQPIPADKDCRRVPESEGRQERAPEPSPARRRAKLS
jgi:hypothetical protein